MPIGDDFERVLAEAQEGDDAALETIYRELSPLVLGYLRSRGAAHPEDLTSETFVAVVRNVHRFRGSEDKLRSWVLTIAHRRMLDERRRQARRPEQPDDPDALPDDAGAPDAESMAFERLGDDRVRDLLAELTDDQRAVVMLRVVADLPVKEVARVLGKRPGAVKTMHRRAMARLARVIEGQGDGPEPAGAHAASPPESGEPSTLPFPDGAERRSPERP